MYKIFQIALQSVLTAWQELLSSSPSWFSYEIKRKIAHCAELE